jgi:4-carboxymuconolactone decarboxylase
VARLPYVDPADAPGEIGAALERLPQLNIFRMLANADSAFIPWLRWAGALLTDLELDPLLRELAILRVAQLTPHAEYEWVQHVPIAQSVGATDEQVAAIEAGDIAGEDFNEVERAVLRFTTEVVEDVRAGDEAFAALAALLPPRQIVELLMVIGNYMFVARVMATTELEMDEPAADDLTNPIDRVDRARQDLGD